MNLRETMEIAALISSHSFHVIEQSRPLPYTPLQRLWESSQSRLIRWVRALQRSSGFAVDDVDADSANSTTRELVIEEIYATEAITRVWGAVLTARDRFWRRQECERLARSLLLGHLEARRRALIVMVEGDDVPIASLARLDRMRRRVERWTDRMLTHLFDRFEVQDFAFDAERATCFGAERMTAAHSLAPEAAGELLMIGLRTAFPAEIGRRFPHGALDAEIVRSILGCFDEDAFDSQGTLKSIRFGRIRRSSERRESPPPAERPF